MVNKIRFPLFSAEVIDEYEFIFFYIVENIDYSEPHSIKTYVAPYSNAGRTQNLGRFPIELSYDIMIVKYENPFFVVTIDDTIQKILNAKRNRKKLRLSVPNLPLGSSRFYIGDFDLGLKEPNRLTASISFTEILEDSLGRSVENLVLNNAMENIKALLRQKGQI